MVSSAWEFRFRTYTSLFFSIAAIRHARPFGSQARYSPGTFRRTPDFPKVSKCNREKRFSDGRYSMMVIRPESVAIIR